jgi:hypothetical protein
MSNAAQPQIVVPAIRSPWPGVDGVYVGIAGAEGDRPDRHVVLLNAVPPRNMNWNDVRAWAHGLGDDARIPTLAEGALLRANAKSLLPKEGWMWLDEQYSSYGAWGQGLSSGSQDDTGKEYEGLVRAVRSFNVQSFSPSSGVTPIKPDMTNALLRQILDETIGLRTDMRTIFLADTEA